MKLFLLVAVLAAAAVAHPHRVHLASDRGVQSYLSFPDAEFEVAPACQRESDRVGKLQCMQSDFKRIARAAPESQTTVYFGIRRRNMDTLRDMLHNELANPASPAFRKWLTRDEVVTMTANPAATEAVVEWCRRFGLDVTVQANGEYVDATGPVSAVEKMLNTELHTYASHKRAMTVVRASRFFVPHRMTQHVQMVGNVVDFPATLRPLPMLAAHEPTNHTKRQSGQTTPSLLNSHYHVSSNTVASSAATQAVYEALGQSYSPTDLAAFQQKYNIPSQKIATVKGPNSPSSCEFNPNSCAEASLDVEYLIAMAQGSDTWYWSIPTSTQSIFKTWAQQLLATSNPPLVHSISYGSIEQEEPQSNLQTFDQDIMTLGTRGLTVVVATGDDGVANFQARSNPGACGFHPSFPATSPHVLAVGATQGPEFGQPEVVCSSKTGGLITSGGGFSTVFSRPSFQNTVVENYLTNGAKVPPTTDFASTGRAYPDVSSLGHNYVVAIAGSFYILSGTSCSTPVTAGMMTLINGMLLNSGKSSLGFVTPSFYSTPSSNAYIKITSGENNCCAGQQGSQVCCSQGFSAQPDGSWSPTCGFGSLDFANTVTLLGA